jgi:hypothetical protein
VKQRTITINLGRLTNVQIAALAGGALGLVLLVIMLIVHAVGPATPAVTTPHAGDRTAGATGAPAGTAAGSGTGSVAPGQDEPDETPQDATAPGGTDAELAAARQAAVQFVAAWLNTTGKTPEQWRAGLSQKLTPAQVEQFADADPESVPPGRIGTPIDADWGGDHLAVVSLPIIEQADRTNTHVLTTVVVTMVAGPHGWLVSAVDNKPGGTP